MESTRSNDISESGSLNAAASVSDRSTLSIDILRRRHEIPPAHHITSKVEPRILASLPSVLSLVPTSFEALPGSLKEEVEAKDEVQSNVKRAYSYLTRGFCNPWPSWHKPRIGEVWNGLRWTKRGDEINLDAESSNEKADDCSIEKAEGSSGEAEKAERQVDGLQEGIYSDAGPHIVQPDLSPPDCEVAKATWLGHATVLLQLSSLQPDASDKHRSYNILFDPIFSMRCSPTQYLGPLRFFPSPCSISALPEVDIVIISHSHYDHLDYDSIVELWQLHKDYIHFLVPLGLRDWFLGLNIGIAEDRVTELDWWDEISLHDASHSIAEKKLRIVCTPAQHGSGRYGLDASQSLWASWTIEYITQDDTFRVFFGGDTGFQFHSPVSTANQYPTCPAFAEVCKYIGKPDLSFLPISVGASFNFIKSYDMFGVVPEVDHGLTAANHLTPHDAVRVAKILRDYDEDISKGGDQLGGVAVAIHWGTFVVDLEEARQSQRDLRRSCDLLDVDYVSHVDQRKNKIEGEDDSSRLQFACVNHGQSIHLSMRQKADRIASPLHSQSSPAS